MADHYSTLGISKDAGADDIKRAYRKLASQHHPDKGGDTKKFQEIEEAYRTLSDPEKRQQYDNPQPQFGGRNLEIGAVFILLKQLFTTYIVAVRVNGRTFSHTM